MGQDPSTMAVNEIKLFDKYTYDDVTVSDMALTDYLAVKTSDAVYLPHSAGRWQKKRFKKAQCPLIERLTCSLMKHGRNSGKKVKAVRIVRHTCAIISLLTAENPLQVIVDAVINSGPVRILPASDPLVSCVVRLSTSPPFVASTRQSGSSPLVPASPPSVTSRPSLSASPRSS